MGYMWSPIYGFPRRSTVPPFFFWSLHKGLNTCSRRVVVFCFVSIYKVPEMVNIVILFELRKGPKKDRTRTPVHPNTRTSAPPPTHPPPPPRSCVLLPRRLKNIALVVVLVDMHAIHNGS